MAGVKHGGRQKGSANLVHKQAGMLVLATFEAIGGVEAFAKWANENKDMFYCHIFRYMLPKQVALQADVRTAGIQINAVSVADPSEALSALERLQDVSDAHWGRGEGGDEGEVDPQLSTYEVRMPPADGSGAGSEAPEGAPDAAEARQDEDGGERPAVPLPDTVPVA